MKKLIIAFAGYFLCGAALAQSYVAPQYAQYNAPQYVNSNQSVIADSFEMTAKVLTSTPIVGPQSQIARQVCTPVTVTTYQQQSGYSGGGNNTTGAILGGLGGAIVGSRFGNGNGRSVATAVGAIAGTMAGNSYNSAPAQVVPVQQVQNQCQYVTEQVAGQVVGYQVTYEYQGKQGTTMTRNPPGTTLKIRTRVTVEE